MRAELLEYLSDNDTGQLQKLNDFLLTLPISSSPSVVSEMLKIMEDNNLVSLDGQWNKIGIQNFTLHNVDVHGKIRPNGLIENNTNKAFKKQQEILETQVASTISTNAALRDSSTSIINLNTKTGDYYKVQRNTGYAISVFTAVTMLIGIATFIRGCVNNEVPDKLELQELKNRQSVLDSTLKAHIRIDSLEALEGKKTYLVLPLDSSKTKRQ